MIQKTAFLFILVGLSLLVFTLFPKRASKALSTPDERMASEWVLPNPVSLPTLNPLKVLSATEKSLMLLPFSRLVKSGDHLQVEPDALERWSYNPQTRRMTLVLRPQILFHDGQPLRARDVVFSFHEWARPGSLDSELLEPVRGAAEFTQGLAKRISGIHMVDERRIEIEIGSGGAERLLHSLSQARFCIFPEDYRGKTADEYFAAPIGTGPFRVESFTPARVEYVANPFYYFGIPRLKRLSLVQMEMNAAIAAFKRREIDNLIMYHLSEVGSLEGPDVVVQRISRTNTFAAILNTSHPVFGSERIRRYLAKRIDRKELAKDCFPGSDLAHSFIPRGMMGGRSTTEETGAAVGGSTERIGGKPLASLTFYTITNENGECTAHSLSHMLAPLGMRVEARSYKELFAMLKAGKLHAWAESSEFKSDDPYQNLMYFTSASSEFLLGTPVAFVEQAFQRLNHGNLSPMERSDLYQQVDGHLVEHAHVIPLLHFSNYVVYRDTVRNLDFLRNARFSANWHRIEVLAPHAAE